MKPKASHMWTALSFVSCIILLAGASALRPKRAADNFSQCSPKTKWISGFASFSPVGSPVCVGRPKQYYGQTSQCIWQPTLKSDYYSWNECPSGYFYQGFGYKEILCCKPSGHPRRFSACYNLGITEQNRATECSESHFVTGTEDIKSGDAINTKTLRCCKMFDNGAQSDGDVIDRIKDETLVPLSLLADYLGFSWCAGCRAHVVGENFVKTTTGWSADPSGSCEGYRASERLRIDYAGWKVVLSKLDFNETEISPPESVSVFKGTVKNNLTWDTTLTRLNTFTKRRTMTHTKLSSFKFTQGMSVDFTIGIPGMFEDKIYYNFNYENTQQDEKGEEKEDSVTDNSEIQIPVKACSVVEYDIIATRAKATQYYSCDVQMAFSVALSSFLRQGGGQDTNFHESYRQSSERPTFRYEFGNEKISFYDDLKEKSDNSVPPWQWRNMISKYDPLATTALDLLTNASHYKFQLRGKFEGTESTDFWIRIEELEPISGCRKHETNTEESNTTEKYQVTERSLLKRQLRSPDDTPHEDWNGKSPVESSANSHRMSLLETPEDGNVKVVWKKLDIKTGKLYDVDERQIVNLGDNSGQAGKKYDGIDDVYVSAMKNRK